MKIISPIVVRIENANLKQQVVELTQQSKNTPTYAPPPTTKQSADLNYPKITKKYDDAVAIEKLKALTSFHDSLTSSQRSELASRSVPQSEFVIGVTFPSEAFNLAFMEGGYEMTEINGWNLIVIPFDCSHNVKYIYLL